MNFISAYVRIKNQSIDASGQRISISADSLDDFEMKAYADLKLNYPKFYKMDSQSKMGMIAAEVLLKNNVLSAYKPEEIAIVLSNADASLDADLNYQRRMQTTPSPAMFVYTLSNIVAGEICIRFGIKGENAFFVNPDFDPTQMSEYVDLVLTQKGSEACIAGWVNVVRNEHDVFLYLIEKQKRGVSLEHSRAALMNLYLS